jgi:hypothetical protein
LYRKVVGRVVESTRQVGGCGQHSLPQAQIGGVTRKLAQTAKEIRDLGPNVPVAGSELHLGLLQSGDRCIQLALPLGFFLNKELQNGIA